jgi:phosphohistidine phosphatase
MKTLYVLRHAKSDWGDSSLRDFDRPLNERGRKAAKAVGKEMRKRGIAPDLVLASPALRAQQTLERVQHGFGERFKVNDEPSIYAAGLQTLAQIVRAAPDQADRVMIVGHNPGLQELVVELAGSGERLEEAKDRFPTAALAQIRFDVTRWSDVEPGSGQLAELLEPRDL